ncbi:hypothetical protein BH10BAC1_BH10BAC1_13260 [soil metagenome]
MSIYKNTYKINLSRDKVNNWIEEIKNIETYWGSKGYEAEITPKGFKVKKQSTERGEFMYPSIIGNFADGDKSIDIEFNVSVGWIMPIVIVGVILPLFSIILLGGSLASGIIPLIMIPSSLIYSLGSIFYIKSWIEDELDLETF